MPPTHNSTEYAQPFQTGGNRIQQGNSRLSRANSKSCSSISDVKGFKWPCPSSLASCDLHPSLGLVLLPVCDSTPQISHSSGIPNTSASPTQLRLHFHSCDLLEILAFSGSRPGTGLPHIAWHPQFFLTMEEDSTAP